MINANKISPQIQNEAINSVDRVNSAGPRYVESVAVKTDVPRVLTFRNDQIGSIIGIKGHPDRNKQVNLNNVDP